MPELILEMKKDLTNPKTQFLREFFVISKHHSLNTGGKNELVYYFEEHDYLEGKCQILENEGYLINVTPVNATKYRFNEHFVEMIKKYG